MLATIKNWLLIVSVITCITPSGSAANEQSAADYIMQNDECLFLRDDITNLVYNIITSPSSSNTDWFIQFFEETVRIHGLKKSNKQILKHWIAESKTSTTKRCTRKSARMLNRLTEIIDASHSKHKRAY
jgi:hypothetical protein